MADKLPIISDPRRLKKEDLAFSDTVFTWLNKLHKMINDLEGSVEEQGHDRLHNILSALDHSGFSGNANEFLRGDRTWGAVTSMQIHDFFGEWHTNFLKYVIVVAKEGGQYSDIQSAIDSIPENNEDPYLILICPGVYVVESDYDLKGRYVGFMGIGDVVITGAGNLNDTSLAWKLYCVINIKWEISNCGVLIQSYLHANSYPRKAYFENIYLKNTLGDIGNGTIVVKQVDLNAENDVFVYAQNIRSEFPVEGELTDNTSIWLSNASGKMVCDLSDISHCGTKRAIFLLSENAGAIIEATVHNLNSWSRDTGCIQGFNYGINADVMVYAGLINANTPIDEANLTLNYLAVPPINIQKQLHTYGTSGGADNGYTLTPDPAITEYVAGMCFCFIANHTNTGASTLAVSGLEAKSIKKNISGNLEAGDITENQIYYVIYDGTNFQLLSTKIGNGGGVGNHNLLDGDVHPDTLVGVVTRGGLAVGQLDVEEVKWKLLTLGSLGQVLYSDGTDAKWAQLSHTKLSDIGVNDHHTQIHKDTHKSGGGDAFISTDVLEAVVKRLQCLGEQESTPSTAGTTTASNATYYPFQRNSFYANDLFWVFYSDGTNMVYNTSSDGVTWNAKVTAKEGVAEGYSFSIWFDGTFLHYVYTKNSSILYRRGTPEANGTITWSAVEQTVQAGNNDDPSISVDSGGYPWIGYRVGTLPFVTKSSANDGTWTTAANFPYQLSATGASNWFVTPVPLTDLKMLVIYAVRNVTIKSKRWTGALGTWGDEKTTTSSLKYEAYYSATAQGDNVHLVFMKVTTFDILHTQYTYDDDAWGAETTVQATVTADSAPVLAINSANNDLYCFWMGSPTAKHVYYKKRTDSTWDADPTDWIDETTDNLTGVNTHVSFYKDFGSKIGLVYMTKTGSPYNIRFKSLIFGQLVILTMGNIPDGKYLKRSGATIIGAD